MDPFVRRCLEATPPADSAVLRGTKPMVAAFPIVHDPDEDLTPPPMLASDAECQANQIAPRERDVCAHLLIEMRRCMRREFYVSWRCVHEKHLYEACLAHEYALGDHYIAAHPQHCPPTKDCHAHGDSARRIPVLRVRPADVDLEIYCHCHKCTLINASLTLL